MGVVMSQQEQKKVKINKGLSREELFTLHEHYENALKGKLTFCYQYINFYIGLLSAILAVTITGLLTIHSGDKRGLALLLGPILAVMHARIGYWNVEAFYERFVEAWVAQIHIESMLNIRYTAHIDISDYEPRYKSEEGGFIPIYKPGSLGSALKDATNRSAEEEVGELLKAGRTLRHAKWTFITFGVAVIELSFLLF
jgi:hypothetical protein